MPFELSVPRAAAFAAIVLVGMGLSACTTTEGTNAFASPQTFETEVMDKTAQGLGLIPTPVKPDPTNLRGPLVLPKDTKDLPPPQTADAETAALPVDDTKPKIDTTGLSAADIEHAKKRSIFTPPEQYFSLDNNQQDLVCLSKTGDLVSVNDPSCPVEIRNALLKKKS